MPRNRSPGLAADLISSRVGRTAAEHGIRVTTIYTDPDSRAQHALSSPFAYNLGSVSAYLDGDRIIEIAKKEGCRGIHPGYGFVCYPWWFRELYALSVHVLLTLV